MRQHGLVEFKGVQGLGNGKSSLLDTPPGERLVTLFLFQLKQCQQVLLKAAFGFHVLFVVF